MPTPTRRIRGAANPFHAAYVDDVVWTVGAEATNVITVSAQLKDQDYNNVTKAALVTLFLSGTAAASALVTTAPTGGVAVTVGSQANADVAGKMVRAFTNAAGLLTFTLTDTGTPTFYANIVGPDGYTHTSPAITFA